MINEFKIKNVSQYLAITGIDSESAMILIASLLLRCAGRCSFVLPWTARAATPQLSIILHNFKVSFKSGNNRILQLTGTAKLLTREVKISLTLSGWFNRAAPIPPLIENSFGHPILTSNPATSFSLQTKIDEHNILIVQFMVLTQVFQLLQPYLHHWCPLERPHNSFLYHKFWKLRFRRIHRQNQQYLRYLLKYTNSKLFHNKVLPNLRRANHWQPVEFSTSVYQRFLRCRQCRLHNRDSIILKVKYSCEPLVLRFAFYCSLTYPSFSDSPRAYFVVFTRHSWALPCRN